jgi:hypothetical protein
VPGPVASTSTLAKEKAMRHEQLVKEVFDFGYKSLGQVVYHFQELEAELARAVSFLIDPKEGDGADVVVCELSFKQLAHIGYSLFDLYNSRVGSCPSRG